MELFTRSGHHDFSVETTRIERIHNNLIHQNTVKEVNYVQFFKVVSCKAAVHCLGVCNGRRLKMYVIKTALMRCKRSHVERVRNWIPFLTPYNAQQMLSLKREIHVVMIMRQYGDNVVWGGLHIMKPQSCSSYPPSLCLSCRCLPRRYCLFAFRIFSLSVTSEV